MNRVRITYRHLIPVALPPAHCAPDSPTTVPRHLRFRLCFPVLQPDRLTDATS
ncbi:hypothetical protein SAMN05192549_1188 [Duganella sacchari]|uniref:Uncharacterized protein n=1 Tax=Duganella sacchari TaxID=551987 RepID=A0A1M7RBH4_9BURK|nr:hypothetical protein SAMN05192549_1188 [Duganella sacchari]